MAVRFFIPFYIHPHTPYTVALARNELQHEFLIYTPLLLTPYSHPPYNKPHAKLSQADIPITPHPPHPYSKHHAKLTQTDTPYYTLFKSPLQHTTKEYPLYKRSFAILNSTAKRLRAFKLPHPKPLSHTTTDCSPLLPKPFPQTTTKRGNTPHRRT